MRRSISAAIAVLALTQSVAWAAEDPGARLLRAYPDHLSHVDGAQIVWRDGTRMPISDGVTGKSFDEMLANPDLDDMFTLPYPKGAQADAPQTDPGRVRHSAFFKKMYGDCAKNGVAPQLVSVPWLAGYGGGTVKVTRVNGVDKKMAAVAAELSKLPPAMIKTYLIPHAGTYNCRVIAKTNRPSAHGFGVALDIAQARSDYWQWSPNGAYRNRIPQEIVEIFERHGFIWGGKWKSFDTMHFEYRPELLLD